MMEIEVSETHPEYFRGKKEVEDLVVDTINEVIELKCDHIEARNQYNLDGSYYVGYFAAIREIEQLLSMNGFPTRRLKYEL